LPGTTEKGKNSGSSSRGMIDRDGDRVSGNKPREEEKP
jgi:hypothetical protein